MASVHKSTPRQATNLVLASGSCLPGMVTCTGVAAMPALRSQCVQHNAFVEQSSVLVTGKAGYRAFRQMAAEFADRRLPTSALLQ